MANLIETMSSFFRSAKPTGRLAEVAAAIKAAEAERDQHLARRPAEVISKLTGDLDAAKRVDAIDQALAVLEARLRDLREADNELRRRLAAETAAGRRREAETRPKRIAELRRERLALMQQVTQAMEAAAAAMKATAKNADELAALLDHQPAHRFLNFNAFRVRVRSSFARAFAIDPAGSLTESNSLLGIACHEVGERSWWTALQHEQCGMDDLAAYFDNEAEALAAKERLAARSTKTVVVPLHGGIFTLIRAEEAFGSRAAAEKAAADAAAGGRRLSIIEHGGGFVALPARFAEGVA